MKMTLSTFVSVLALAFSAEAASVSITSCTQDAATSRVTVGYELSGGPAIVTFSLATTGGEPLPPAVSSALTGDIDRRLPAGAHTFSWVPGDDVATAGLASGVRIVLTAWADSNPPKFMVVDPALGDVRYYEDKAQIPGGLTGSCNRSSSLVFRHVAAKGRTFAMGSDESDNGHLANETQHAVTFTNDFWMGVFPVTQGQYREIMNGSNPSYALANSYACRYPDCAMRPVEQVTYGNVRGSSGADWPNDGHSVVASSVVGVLRTRTGIDRFDLPTEAEWEFACRAGTTSALYDGRNWSAANVKEIAWVQANSLTGDAAAAVVGEKEPNAWDLYDMLGTVAELCLDWYSDDLGSAAVTAPTGPTSGDHRVTRGGGMVNNSPANMKTVRSAARLAATTPLTALMIGFRLACAIPVAENDAPVSAHADLTPFARLVTVGTETTGHGTPEQPFEAWDRAFGEAAIEKFSSFPYLGFLLFLK